jgi:thiol-disulfide isomerase/thioredoxin
MSATADLTREMAEMAIEVRDDARKGPAKPLWRCSLVTLGLAVALVACGGESAHSQHGVSPPGSGATAAQGTGVGDVAPNFSLATLAGSTFHFPTGKPTAVWFTANGCRSCIPKAQALDRIKASVGDRLAVVGVDIAPGETESTFRDWIKEVGNPRFEFALDKGSKLAVAWGVKDTSTIVITDASGKVIYNSLEAADEQTFRAALSKAGLA